MKKSLYSLVLMLTIACTVFVISCNVNDSHKDNVEDTPMPDEPADAAPSANPESSPAATATPEPSPVDLNPEETFDQADAPQDLSFDSLSFVSPWGYYKTENSARKYPLLVAGFWGEGDDNYRRDVEQTYPAFTLEYQYDSSSAGEALAEWMLDAVEAGYRIDTNRIYLTGFSRGGSGSFPLAKGMSAGGMPFAAIIRCAGQSQTDLTNAIAEKTALWYHVGTEDTDNDRIGIARQTLKNFRSYECYEGATEITEIDNITGHERMTIKFNRGGVLTFIYSEYTGMGHTSSPCYKDDALFAWLFSQSLPYR